MRFFVIVGVDFLPRVGAVDRIKVRLAESLAFAPQARARAALSNHLTAQLIFYDAVSALKEN